MTPIGFILWTTFGCTARFIGRHVQNWCPLLDENDLDNGKAQDFDQKLSSFAVYYATRQ